MHTSAPSTANWAFPRAVRRPAMPSSTTSPDTGDREGCLYSSALHLASISLLTANCFLTALKHAGLHAHSSSAPIRLANAAGAAEHIQLANAAAPLPLRGQASCKECAHAQARRKE